MASSNGRNAIKRFHKWGNPLINTKNIYKNNTLEQLNDSQEAHRKSNNTQKWQKITQNSSPVEIYKCENNFIHLDH